MSVIAIRPDYHGQMKDSADKFHGNQLLYIGWDQHLMYATPFCVPLPPEMPFRALVDDVLPGLFGQHPQFAAIDWNRVEWLHEGKPFRPDMDKSLSGNGLVHKALVRLRTPGLEGLAGAAF